MNSPMRGPRKRRLLAVFAHPDDESFSAGGALAQYVDQGGEAMVVSFTRGQHGQIRDPDAAIRHTLGAVRERELQLACARLGVQHSLCLDYMDGSLSALDPRVLIDEVLRLIQAFQPDTVLTFDREGGTGHPDHIAISKVVTQAFHQAQAIACYPKHPRGGPAPHAPSRLYHSVFVPQDNLLGEELALWLRGREASYRASTPFVNAMPLFAGDLSTLGFIRDDVSTEWYPPGISIIEPGEIGDSLFMILSGEVDLIEDAGEGRGRVLGRKGRGEFLGEASLIDRRPSRVQVVAATGVTCLVLARERPSLHVPRGGGARASTAAPAGLQLDACEGQATSAVDISRYVEWKVAAISAHRTQYSIAPALLPKPILRHLFGTEYFLRVASPVERETSRLQASGDERDQEQAA